MSTSILRRRTYRTDVCSITVGSFQGSTVRVDDLAARDEAIRDVALALNAAMNVSAMLSRHLESRGLVL